mmetsp:Transcript_96632/g.141328  ORF Transcript_96632/g.141328 Transcript_96632/m.141328 type:complete len:274 (+) Transcript_96632:2-823(+)
MATVDAELIATSPRPRPWKIKALISQFSEPSSEGVCSSSTRGDPNIHLVSTGVSSNPAANPGAQRVSDTQKVSAPNSTSSPTPNRVAAHGSSSPAASRKSTHQEASWEGNSSNASHSSGQLDSKSDNEVQKLQERCAKLEVRLSRQNAAVLEFEGELQVYEAGTHEALLTLGVEEGLRGLNSMSAVEQLQTCIDTLLDSESHLLNRVEEMNDEILQQRELNSAVMRKLHEYITKEQEQDQGQDSATNGSLHAYVDMAEASNVAQEALGMSTWV